MTEQRIGIGIDVHRFETTPSGRPLILGGVNVADGRPLIGHSDADAVAHAVADAILGAAGLGDLGEHFPDTDPKWRGANSLELLFECVRLAAVDRWQLTNADCTVICEQPKIAPIRKEMIERLSAAAGGPIHVKATRPERLGSLGRVEGIACFSVALLQR